MKIVIDAAPITREDGSIGFATAARSLKIYEVTNGGVPSSEYGDVPSSEKFYAVYPGQMTSRTNGEAVTKLVEENTAGGFLEDLLPASEITPELIDILKDEVDIRRRVFGGESGQSNPIVFHAYIEDGGARERILDMVRRQTPSDRLKKGDAQHDAFRVVGG